MSINNTEWFQGKDGFWQAEFPGGTEIKPGGKMNFQHPMDCDCYDCRQDWDEPYTDAQLEELWGQLGDIPVTEEGEELDMPFMHFEKGDSKWDVWHWFDERHSKGVAWLMNADGKRYPEGGDDAD